MKSGLHQDPVLATGVHGIPASLGKACALKTLSSVLQNDGNSETNE